MFWSYTFLTRYRIETDCGIKLAMTNTSFDRKEQVLL